MRVGVVNFQDRDNYGAVLQAAALEWWLRSRGVSVVHLDFRPVFKTSFARTLGRSLRRVASSAHLGVKGEAHKRSAVLEEFRIQHLSRSHSFSRAEEWRAQTSSLDAVIVGSDQVWRPAFARDIYGYFLGYVPRDVDRIAYAASFGTSSWEPDDQAVLTTRLRGELVKFKAVSCREDSGVAICREVFGVRASHVLDPVLLAADDYFDQFSVDSRLANPAGLVSYKLDVSNDYLEDLAELATRSGQQITTIGNRSEFGGLTPDQSVSAWISMLRSADTVVTDSFHGMCLALRFNKKIVYSPNPARGQARFDSLFRQFDIKLSRIVGTRQPLFELCLQQSVEASLIRMRVESSLFFDAALER